MQGQDQQQYWMMPGGGTGSGRQTISIGPRGIVLPTQSPSADYAADGSRAGGPAGAASARPNNWSDNHLAPTAAESAALAGEPQALLLSVATVCCLPALASPGEASFAGCVEALLPAPFSVLG